MRVTLSFLESSGFFLDRFISCHLLVSLVLLQFWYTSAVLFLHFTSFLHNLKLQLMTADWREHEACSAGGRWVRERRGRWYAHLCNPSGSELVCLFACRIARTWFACKREDDRRVHESPHMWVVSRLASERNEPTTFPIDRAQVECPAALLQL